MQKSKKLTLANGRSYDNRNTLYACGNSKADIARQLEAYSGGYPTVNSWLRELRDYWNVGVWGNAMEGIKKERGIWLGEDVGSRSVPIRVWPETLPPEPIKESRACCCGRITDWTEPTIINDTTHEAPGDGMFCGPTINHDLRDLVLLVKEAKGLLMQCVYPKEQPACQHAIKAYVLLDRVK